MVRAGFYHLLVFVNDIGKPAPTKCTGFAFFSHQNICVYLRLSAVSKKTNYLVVTPPGKALNYFADGDNNPGIDGEYF